MGVRGQRHAPTEESDPEVRYALVPIRKGGVNKGCPTRYRTRH